MKRSLFLVLIAACVLANAEERFAPRLLNYQGYLTDTINNPITNPSVAMTFSIYDAASTGNLKWTEDQSSVGVSKGIFHVLLGGANPIPDSVFKAAADRWLELSIGGLALSPRTRIVSVPYAYSATYSDTALYAQSSSPDIDWSFLVSDGADTTLQMGGRWGLTRSGNVQIGYYDSTHVNLGCASTTGFPSQNFKYCTVGGGYNNRSRGPGATIAGGYNNHCSSTAEGAAIGGGYDNNAGHGYTTIAGGSGNYVSQYYGSIGGGYGNRASGHSSTISGGYQNRASAEAATVGGGMNNQARGEYSTVGGGGNDNAADSNSAIGNYSTIGGGIANIARGANAVIGGGLNNRANGNDATVGGGNLNIASGYRATIAGGNTNTASNSYSTIAGGSTNVASGWCATVGGGDGNANAGDWSAILGGYADTIAATGDYSYLFGINSNLTQDSTFMVDMPHVWFGTEANGYEFPYGRGIDGQVMKTNGSGLLSWGSITYVDSARVAANAHKLQSKDTVDFNVDYVNEGQVNSITNVMISDGAVTTPKIADTAVTMPKIAPAGATVGQVIKWNGTAWQPSADSSMDSDWTYRVTDGADTTLEMSGRWGIARYGNTLYGNADSTHVNFGVGSTTGINGQNYKYITVGGGYNNAAGLSYATVGGGVQNNASGQCALVSGGSTNTASAECATVAGGNVNTASNYNATVGGGQGNIASGYIATVGGGKVNRARGAYSVVAGGGGGNDADSNSAKGDYSSIGGGYSNVAGGFAGTVGGGYWNYATNQFSTIAGGRLNAAGGAFSTVGGGHFNKARGNLSVVSGGGGNVEADSNSAIGDYSSIGGGYHNITSGNSAVVSGGRTNTASNWYAVVSGGQSNTASGQYSSVGGGEANIASSHRATIAGGSVNQVAGEYSAILGGFADTIFTGASYSYLFGINSNLTQDSTFMVDMPHVWLGTEANGYEFPYGRGTDGQVMKTDGSGKLSWGSITYIDSARVAANAHKLQGKDTVDLNIDYVNEGQVNSITNAMIQDGAVTTSKIVDTAVTMPKIAPAGASVGQVIKWNGSAWQPSEDSSMDNDWSYRITDGADTTLQMGGAWGLTRPGNVAFGNADSTHVNFGVACTTGISGNDFKYNTVAGGLYNSAANRSTVGGGQYNGARGEMSTVSGGSYNVAGGWTAAIGGGDHNSASNQYSFVGGGQSNTASGERSTVGGGYQNTASGLRSFVGGGYQNSASNQYAVVAGGTSNSTGGNFATIGGGSTNSAIYMGTVAGGFQNNASTNATIAGGVYNSASGLTSTVGGGNQNLAGGTVATVSGGRYNKARGSYSVVAGGGGANDADSNSAIGDYSVISGGAGNIARGNYAVLAGGYQNTASSDLATVVDGRYNLAGGITSFVGSGEHNTASGTGAGVVGGYNNTANGVYSFVGSGMGNAASAYYTAVSGGYGCAASGVYAAVGGGNANSAVDSMSYAGGGSLNMAAGKYSAILGGLGNMITAAGDYSYLFGINSNLTQDSTFMVDMPHVWFGTEAGGYEFPYGRGANGQVMVTDGSGKLSWGSNSDNDWTISGSDMYSAVSGNVGIGTTSPTAKLDVSGTVQVTGFEMPTGAANGYVLTSDASGAGTWLALPGAPVSSVFGRTGTVVAASGDYTTTLVTEGTNLYFTDARAQAAITGGASTIATSNLTANRALLSDGSGKVAVSVTTNTELGYLSGATSSIQTQLSGKQAVITGGASTITSSNLTANRALLSDGSGKVAVSVTTNTELGYLSGATSAIQTQLNGKAPLSSPTFSGNVTMPGTGIWNSSGDVGIGLTSPSAKLDVAGTVKIADGTQALGYVFTSDANGLGSWQAIPNDNDWAFLISDDADTTLRMGGRWGIARAGNTMYGNADSTHVNLGVGCVTGTNGQDYKYCTVSGGYLNTASGDFASVSGGRNNTASGLRATVGGGWGNTASNYEATAGGGTNNNASGNQSVIAGGGYNVSPGTSSAIGGGYGNNTGGTGAAIAGGEENDANGSFTAVAGGKYNAAIGEYANIGGGENNFTTGNYSAILGGYADTILSGANYSYLFGINSNLTQDSTFMVDLPHVRFGTEAAGYEFPTADGSSGQALVTDGSGKVSFGTPTDAGWTISGSDQYSAVSGKVGVGASAPTAKLDVAGATGYDQVRMRTTYTPTSSSDANGNIGDVAWDDSYVYVKTSGGWKRSALSSW